MEPPKKAPVPAPHVEDTALGKALTELLPEDLLQPSAMLMFEPLVPGITLIPLEGPRKRAVPLGIGELDPLNLLGVPLMSRDASV